MLVVLYFVLIGPPPISPEVTGLEDLATMTATDAAAVGGHRAHRARPGLRVRG